MTKEQYELIKESVRNDEGQFRWELIKVLWDIRDLLNVEMHNESL